MDVWKKLSRAKMNADSNVRFRNVCTEMHS